MMKKMHIMGVAVAALGSVMLTTSVASADAVNTARPITEMSIPGCHAGWAPVPLPVGGPFVSRGRDVLVKVAAEPKLQESANGKCPRFQGIAAT